MNVHKGRTPTDGAVAHQRVSAGEKKHIPSIALNPDALDDFDRTLRNFGEAYPTSVFGPVTPQEIQDFGNLITRNSAAMGRHLATFMVQAADVIAELRMNLEESGAMKAASDWEDRADDYTAIVDRLHPLETQRYDLWMRASELVGNRNSKGALVELVNALLAQSSPDEQATARSNGAR